MTEGRRFLFRLRGSRIDLAPETAVFRCCLRLGLACILLLAISDGTHGMTEGNGSMFSSVPTSCKVARWSQARGQGQPLNDVESCLYTFQQAWDSPSDKGAMDVADNQVQETRAMAKCCPPRCLDWLHSVSNGSASAAAVYGSFPYHANSSVCLAAIHSGLVTNEEGGWLMYGRFGAYHQPVILDLTDPIANIDRFLFNGSYRPQLAKIPGGELFPFNSSLPSLSNGVQSLHSAAGHWGDDGSGREGFVPFRISPVPELPNATIRDFSYVVYSRGTLVSVAAQAPFGPRSGHLQLFADSPQPQDWLGLDVPRFHLVVGGRNATHYINDVWLGEVIDTETRPEWLFLPDPHVAVQWMRLSDAPFSGRAHFNYEVWQCVYSCPDLPDGSRVVLVNFLGGQVGHQCGLDLLGICSDEVWQLRIDRNSSSATLGLTFKWKLTPQRMPFAVCDATQVTSRTSTLNIALIGGQLSYDDPTCRQPIVTSNDVWYSVDRRRALWFRRGPAPFSPRRTAVADSALGQSAVEGGMRLLSHVVDADSNVARLTSVEVYADVWETSFALPPSLGLLWTHYSNDSGNSSTLGSVTRSLPIPVVSSARSPPTDAATGSLWPEVIIGRTSRVAVSAWLNAVPPLEYDDGGIAATERLVNATSIRQPTIGFRRYADLFTPTAPTPVDIARSRYDLPLMYSLDEAELNDPTAPFTAGSDWVLMHSKLLTGSHEQTSQQVQRAEDSTLWVYQAASSLNTSRHLFDVSLRRHSVAATWEAAASFRRSTPVPISGGRSGHECYRDWLTMPFRCCPHPSDPMYRGVLGNGSLVDASDLGLNISDSWCVDPSSGKIIWRCAEGFHLEPPRAGDRRESVLFCSAEGMWMDSALNTLSTCARDRLHCPSPLVSFGDDKCTLPTPVVTAINTPQTNTLPPVNCTISDDGHSAYDCPQSMINLILSLSGQFFSLPLLVLVGGTECEEPQLHSATAAMACYWNARRNATDCVDYSSGVLCGLRPVLGSGLPIVVLSGRDQQRAIGSPLLTVSFAPPRVTNFSSLACRRSSPLSLLSCPRNGSFWVVVAGYNFWRFSSSEADLESPLQLPTVSLGNYQPVQCLRLLISDPIYQQFVSTDNINTGAMKCTVTPSPSLPLITAVPFLITQQGGQTNVPFTGHHDSSSYLSFMGCPAGHIDVGGPNNPTVSSDERCEPCPLGFSTNGLDGQSHCTLCPLGTSNAVAGSANCTWCRVNTFANTTGLIACHGCPPNSWQTEEGGASCDACDLNQYLVLLPPAADAASERNVSILGSRCQSCLPSNEALCYPNGSILAASTSVYLTVDQSTGLISSSECRGGRCVAIGDCLVAGGEISITPVELTSLSVLNCCGANRLPARSNPLCGRCVDGYSEWNSDCVLCDWEHVDWVLLAFTAALGLSVVWALHRLPNDSRAATLSITLYFFQTTLLFFSSEQLPQLTTLVNLDLVGASPLRSATGYSACLLPLSSLQKIGARAMAPVLAMLYLLLFFVLQRGVRGCAVALPCPRGRRVCTLVHFVLFGELTSADEMTDSRRPAISPILSLTAFNPHLQEALLRKLHSSDELDSKDSKDSNDSKDSKATDQSDAITSAASAPCTESEVVGSSPVSYFHSMVRLCMYGYNNMAWLSLSYFHCQPVNGFGSLLYDYPDVSCQSQEYRDWQWVFLLLFVGFVLVPPIFLSALLIKHHHRIRMKMEADDAGASAAVETEDDSVPASVCARLADRSIWLYSSFKPGYSGFAVVVFLRRLLLVSISVLMPSHSMLVAFTAVNCGALVLHAFFLPYRRRRDNWMETVTLTALFLQTIAIECWPLPWSSSSSSSPPRSISLLLCLALIAAPTTLVLASALRDRCSDGGCAQLHRLTHPQRESPAETPCPAPSASE